MNKTWNVTIFIEEDKVAASARARLTGGSTLGHLVGHGFCRVTPTALQDAGQRAAVHALEDLSHQLDYVVFSQQTDNVAALETPKTSVRSRPARNVPRGMLSLG